MTDDVPAPGATLKAADGDATDHAAVEGAETPDKSGSDSTLREMLLATDPDRPLDEVESPFDPDTGGLARVYRGVQKMTGIDGMPAVVDIVVGGIEAIVSADLDGGGGDGTDDGELGGDRGRV